MFYPLKLKPVYKDYLWGGRNLEKFGKILPPGIAAESWEVSGNPNGVSIIGNGEYTDTPLTKLIQDYGQDIIGINKYSEHYTKFPLLVKLIDANDRLSVSVHPGDDYAFNHENGELGKTEMWYILEAKPDTKLVCDLLPDVTKEMFTRAIELDQVENCLQQITVNPGDTIYIPAGLVHSIGEGIILAEIQQSSDITYRVYDYNRVDSMGNKRPLHIAKALDNINFGVKRNHHKTTGLTVNLNKEVQKKYLVANSYFAVELYTVNGKVDELADGSKFFIYLIIEGSGEIWYENGSVSLAKGDSVLIPAKLGNYNLQGDFKALKTYIPDIPNEIITPLKAAGYTVEEIYTKVSGL